MASSDAPISIGRVAIVVNDLNKMITFYTGVIGLNVISQNREVATLGAGDRALIELRHDARAIQRPNEAGLFHTAILLPTRAKLGSWLQHALDLGITLEGASDHAVSQAIYLQDPEGNGLEIYFDHPRSQWTWTDDSIHLETRPLNLKKLAKASQGNWKSAPTGTVVGHVHLQVGDVGPMDQFMIETLGLSKTFGMLSVGFYSSGGYHHHLAGNIWNSRNVGPRSLDSTGLAEVELLADPGRHSSELVSDPWGTQFRVTPSMSKQPTLDLMAAG